MKIMKSVGCILAGFVTVVLLSIGTDIILEITGIFPPQGSHEPYTTGLLILAFIYRSVYTIAGGYVTARLAPENSMRHAIILGILGIAVGTLGAIANWEITTETNIWYPVALVIAALPCTWLGGKVNEVFIKKN